MASFEFVIPLSFDGLQEASSTRQYVVRNILIAEETSRKITECMQNHKQEGPAFILNNNVFDALYSALINFQSLEEELQIRLWTFMIKVMNRMVQDLGTLLSSNEFLDPNERCTWLNIIKMTTYIASNLTEAFENQHNKPTIDTLTTGRGRKKGGKKTPCGLDWDDERIKILVQFYSLLQHPLNRLWDPPIMEEDFVNLIANCCYKILETPSMNLVQSKPTRDSIFQILGNLIKKYNHGLACSLKLMQLLQHFEHLVSVAAQGVIILIEVFGVTSVVSEVVREIVKIDSQDMSRETSSMRNYSQFLIEVAEKCPQVVMPSLPHLTTFLDHEAYTMRNCVLSIMSSIVKQVLSKEQLDNKSKDLRDQCLDCLELHIHDVHAFVRSKVLQLWGDLVNEKAIPLSRQHHVLELIIGRLKDKSSNVRRQAVQLLTSFLKGNPFAARLPLEELQAEYEIELKKLHEMAPETRENFDAAKGPVDTLPSPKELWDKTLPVILEAIQSSKSEDSEELSLPENCSLNDAVSKVAQALSEEKYVEAIKLLHSALQEFAGVEIFMFEKKDYLATLEAGEEANLSDEDQQIVIILERIFISFQEMKRNNLQTEENEENESEDKNEPTENAEVSKQKIYVSYLKGSVGFAKLIHEGIPVVCQLLGSKQASDVMEAIHFFVTAFEFKVLNAQIGIRKMLPLVFSKEASIKDGVVEAYKRLYINGTQEFNNERVRSHQIVKNLTSLTTGATIGELTSMEEIISQFVKSGDISHQCITLLWEKFTKTLPETTDEEAKSALVLLSMAAGSQISIVQSNISVICNCALGERGEKDFSLVKEASRALSKMADVKIKTDSPDGPIRMDEHSEIFEKLKHIIITGITNLEDKQYSPMALEAITAIYLLAEHPDVICADIIKQLAKLMIDNGKKSDQIEDDTQPCQLQVSMPVLSRFFIVVGHVAIRQFVHLDTFIFSEIKRRNYLKQQYEIESNQKKKAKNRRKSLATSASEASMNRGNQEGDIDEELGLTGAVADDLEAEFIRSICETEIINGENMLGLIWPLIQSICSNPSKYTDTSLRTAVSLALSKFMMISSEYCEQNLQLLFTILEKSSEPIIRANTIIALGDLSFRFPNLVEPWTPRLYARLRDDSSFVRQNTLTVLTHLILNDMLKVKGQISDIALCIIDKDPRIAALSKMFFTELAQKGNSLYNVLPDIISRLSDTEIGVEEEHYRTIIGHIFTLIQKDKQLESLVEKLCHRFQATTLPRQWRDIAYCLSLLQQSEKSIRKISENFNCYSDKLHEPDVYDLFLTILANARKFCAKPEMKMAIEELEGRMQKSHEKGVEDENAVNKAVSAKNKNKRPTQGTKRKAKPKRVESDSEEEEISDEDFESDEAVTKKVAFVSNQGTRTRRSNRFTEQTEEME